LRTGRSPGAGRTTAGQTAEEPARRTGGQPAVQGARSGSGARPGRVRRGRTASGRHGVATCLAGVADGRGGAATGAHGPAGPGRAPEVGARPSVRTPGRIRAAGRRTTGSPGTRPAV